ncbi:MAG TPA: hypothetical protein VFH56_02800 [Acidimicrobiales bacterium]|nr:hypothetical protein [Acidimicrobiales bacterium]
MGEFPAAATRTAQRFMRTKGYPDSDPLGVYSDGSLLFYYYRLPEGVLELELSKTDGHWNRRVTDFITGDQEISEMLGEEDPLLGRNEDREEPTPIAPGDNSLPAVVFKGGTS